MLSLAKAAGILCFAAVVAAERRVGDSCSYFYAGMECQAGSTCIFANSYCTFGICEMNPGYKEYWTEQYRRRTF